MTFGSPFSKKISTLFFLSRHFFCQNSEVCGDPCHRILALPEWDPLCAHWVGRCILLEAARIYTFKTMVFRERMGNGMTLRRRNGPKLRR